MKFTMLFLANFLLILFLYLKSLKFPPLEAQTFCVWESALCPLQARAKFSFASPPVALTARMYCSGWAITLRLQVPRIFLGWRLRE